MAYGWHPTPSEAPRRRHRADIGGRQGATCTGAIAGGKTSPASSLCVITRAPSNLVETPHEVAQTRSRFASLFW